MIPMHPPFPYNFWLFGAFQCVRSNIMLWLQACWVPKWDLSLPSCVALSKHFLPSWVLFSEIPDGYNNPYCVGLWFGLEIMIIQYPTHNLGRRNPSLMVIWIFCYFYSILPFLSPSFIIYYVYHGKESIARSQPPHPLIDLNPPATTT